MAPAESGRAHLLQALILITRLNGNMGCWRSNTRQPEPLGPSFRGPRRRKNPRAIRRGG